jgi:hypothetical protein
MWRIAVLQHTGKPVAYSGTTSYQIESFGMVDISVDTPTSKGTVKLLNVAYIPGYMISLSMLSPPNRNHWVLENNPPS